MMARLDSASRSGAGPISVGLAVLGSVVALACDAPAPDDAPDRARVRRVEHLVDHAPRPDAGAPTAPARGRVGGVSMEVLPSRSHEGPVQRIDLAPVRIAEGDVLEAAIGVGRAADDEAPRAALFTVIARTSEGEREVLRSAWTPGEAGAPWQTHRVPLDALAGDDVALAFEVRGLDGAPAPAHAYWGDPVLLRGGPGSAPARGARPSIVLVSLDTLRARSMSVYGREVPTTPAFERLAGDGTLFMNASTVFSNTYGGHIGMLTGRYVWSTELNPNRRIAGGRGLFLAERLRDAGYATAAFTENALLRGASGFWNGFGTYFEDKEVKRGAGAAAQTFARALDWLRTHDDRSFFLFVHTYQVHGPYEPPDAYAGLFPEILEEPAPAPPEWAAQARDDAADEVLRLRRAYEQEVRYLDDLLVDFVRAVRAVTDGQRVVFVITADHGEEFSEHGAMLHQQLYQEVLHVPLLVLDSASDGTARRVDDVVSIVDVVPTLVELADAGEAEHADGTSLVPLLEGRDLPELARRAIRAASDRNALGSSRRGLAARRGRYKCVHEEGWPEPRCFDLEADAAESTPLPPGSRPELAALAAEIEAYRSAIEASPADPFVEDPVELDPKTLEKLEALGYVE